MHIFVQCVSEQSDDVDPLEAEQPPQEVAQQLGVDPFGGWRPLQVVNLQQVAEDNWVWYFLDHLDDVFLSLNSSLLEVMVGYDQLQRGRLDAGKHRHVLGVSYVHQPLSLNEVHLQGRKVQLVTHALSHQIEPQSFPDNCADYLRLVLDEQRNILEQVPGQRSVAMLDLVVLIASVEEPVDHREEAAH